MPCVHVTDAPVRHFTQHCNASRQSSVYSRFFMCCAHMHMHAWAQVPLEQILNTKNVAHAHLGCSVIGRSSALNTLHRVTHAA